MAAVTTYTKFIIPGKVIPLMKIIDIIRSEEYKDIVLQIQKLYAEGKESEADELKKTLTGFTASCRCDGGRRIDLVTYYTAFIILDLDNLSEEEIKRISDVLRVNEYVFAFFKSCSWKGLKILIETNGTQENHTATYNFVADYFEKLLNVKIDRSGKDIVRLCFMSYDPDAHKNIQNKKLEVPNDQNEEPAKEDSKQTENNNNDKEESGSEHDEIFEYCIQITNEKNDFTKGDRNNFVYYLANNCNRNGIPLKDTLQLILQRFNYDPKEVKTSVHSAYKNHQNDFGKYADSNKDSFIEEVNEQLTKTPLLPEEIFDQLPQILKECCMPFSHSRQRDVMLTGAIGILSGCLPNIYGVYDGHEVYANLYILVIAPPANDKGTLKFASMLAADYHMKLVRQYESSLKEHQKGMRLYKLKCHNAKEDPGDAPEPPVQKLHFIAADSSSAKVKRSLKDCGGRGTICETESDTLGNTFKQDWGGYSDLLRKAFHHERVSYNRVTTALIEIECPCVTTVLSGTPGQSLNLIQSSENGLFSRVLFYAYRSEIKWRNVSPNGSKFNLTAHFKRLSEQVTRMIEFYEQQERTYFGMSNIQWDKLNSRCSELLLKYTVLISDDLASSVFRLGIIVFRMAMIFSALRRFEDGVCSTTLSCLDKDIDLSLQLAECYIQHTVVMFRYLPKPVGVKLDNKKIKFFQALPAFFTRQEAVEIGKAIKIAERTVDKYLKIFQGVFIKKDEYNKYQKL